MNHVPVVQIASHRVDGANVFYPCPACQEGLKSPLMQAGMQDTCPQCGVAFLVPGVDERDQYLAQQAEAEARREQETQARASQEMKRRVDANQRTAQQTAIRDASQEKLQLDRDPMKEWWAYAFIGSILIAVTSGRYLVSAVATDTTFLTPLILTLFGVGVFLNWRGVRRLRTEYVCAAACVHNLDTNGLKSLLEGPPAGIFHKHVQDLGKIARYDNHFNQDTLIGLLYGQLMSRSKIVGILSSTLVSLGLIGTVLGLISMTNGLNETLSSLDGQGGDGLLNGMRDTMSGLGTAFYTTLAGALLGSVALRILNNVYTSNVEQLVSYVAGTTEVQIVPRLKKAARGQSS